MAFEVTLGIQSLLRISLTHGFNIFFIVVLKALQVLIVRQAAFLMVSLARLMCLLHSVKGILRWPALKSLRVDTCSAAQISIILHVVVVGQQVASISTIFSSVHMLIVVALLKFLQVAEFLVFP